MKANSESAAVSSRESGKRYSREPESRRKWCWVLAGAGLAILVLIGRASAAPPYPGSTVPLGGLSAATIVPMCLGAMIVLSALVARARKLFGAAEDYKSIFENAPLGVYRAGLDGCLLLANPALVRMLGYNTADELERRNVVDDTRTDGYSRSEFLRNLERKGGVISAEHSWKRRDNSLLCVRETGQAVFDDEGEVLFYDFTVEDITARKKAEDDLRRSEKQYRGLFEQGNDAVVVFDPKDETILAANERAADLYGFSAEELVGLQLSQFTSDVERGREKIEELLREGSKRVETVHHNRWGEELYLNANSSVIEYNGRSVLLSSLADVSERRKAEEAARDSRALLVSLIDSLPQDVFCKDREGVYTVVNKAFCERAGRPAEEVIGRSAFDLYGEKAARKAEPEDRMVMETGLAITQIDEITLPDGSKAYREMVKAPRFDHAGAVAGVLGLMWDVTEKKLAERALADERDQLSALMDSIPDPIYFKDANSRFVRVNRAFCELAGLAETRAAAGKTDLDLFGPEYALAAGENERQLLTSRTNSIGVVENIVTSGDCSRWFSTTRATIRGEDGQTKGLVGIARDITEKKLAEDSLDHDLESLLSAVSLVSEGDLTIRPPDGNETLGKIAGSINKMLESFGSMLTRVKQIGLSVSSSATEILAASEQIASGAQRQADEVTNTSSTVEQMAATMGQVSRNAESSAKAARQALDIAETGEKLVRDTSDAMGRINNAVIETAAKMKTLAKRGAEISEIMSLINEIASQTNLLSLNAAIEAAHAGEAGLGFSVVAEEIRKLAERSARATRDVGSIVKAIQEESDAALAAMEKGMKEVSSGKITSDQASRSLQNIYEVVRQSSELIAEISTASEEQARVTKDLASAMQIISSITLQTSAGAQETAVTLEGMVQLADHLNAAISKFKVAEDHVHPFSFSA